MLVSFHNVSKRYGKRVLFENVSLSIHPQEKIGLVGPNGAGKTTIFELVLAESEPSSGNVCVRKNAHIGYLPQEAKFSSHQTVLGEVLTADKRIQGLIQEKEELENTHRAASQRYGEILHILEHLGYFELEHRAKKVLTGLGFKAEDFHKPISHLSGGWQMRTLLGKLLTLPYDLLLLDEPTNYLDLKAAVWLKEYLVGFSGAFVLISHDKVFLTEVVKYTLILENSSITRVEGNYEHYEQIQQERRRHLLKQAREQEKKREQLGKFIQRFHAQPNKAAAVRAKKSFLERMEEIAVPGERSESIRDFHFPATQESGHKVIELQAVEKSYGPHTVYKGLDLEVTRSEKIVLAGDNGAGKSTLLKILAGVIPIDSGRRILGHNVTLGYFSQTRLDVLCSERSVLEEAHSANTRALSTETLRTMLGIFLFTGDDVEKKVSVLSGGEKSRLILAKLLISPPNFLLLDEPTTHLDLDAVEALVRALRAYEGTLICISHDIYFVRSIANAVYEVKEGQIRKFFGGFDYYLTASLENNPSFSGKPRIATTQDTKGGAYEVWRQRKEEERKKRVAEHQKKRQVELLKEQLKKINKQKEELEIEQYAKARILANPKSYRDEPTAREFGRRLKEIESTLSSLNREIACLQEKIAQCTHGSQGSFS